MKFRGEIHEREKYERSVICHEFETNSSSYDDSSASSYKSLFAWR